MGYIEKSIVEATSLKLHHFWSLPVFKRELTSKINGGI